MDNEKLTMTATNIKDHFKHRPHALSLGLAKVGVLLEERHLEEVVAEQMKQASVKDE